MLRRVDLAALQAQFDLLGTVSRGDLAEASGSHTALIAIAATSGSGLGMARMDRSSRLSAPENDS